MSGIRSNHGVVSVFAFFSFLPLFPEQYLVSPTSESYVQKSHEVGRKLDRDFYLRAAALTASTFVGGYIFINYFFGSAEKITLPKQLVPPAPDAETVQKAAEVTKTFLRKWVTGPATWLGGAALSLTKICAQSICVQWVSSKVLVNNAEPKIYIARA